MSLLFFDGLQDGATMPKPEWTPAGAMVNRTGRDGSTNGAASLGTGSVLTVGSMATCIVGLAIHWTSVSSPGTTGYFISFVRSGTIECVLQINASGMIELRRTNGTGTLLATSSGHPPIASNSWHHVQAKVVLHSSTGSAVVKLNDATVINYSGQTAGTSGDVTALQTGHPSSGNMYWDDLWVCDAADGTATQGAANNDFLGDLKVVTLYPTAAGDSTQFTPSTGSNWSTVDEVPPNTTDYVTSSAVGNRDLYALGDLPAGAVNPKAVRVGVYAQKTDAGASSVKTVIKESGGAITVGSTQALTQTWAPYYGSIRTVRPSDSAAWTVSDINGLQVGIESA